MKISIEPAENPATEAVNSVLALARDLRDLANRLETSSSGFHSPRISATRLAAEITNDYLQGTGRIGGCRLNVIIAAAGRIDATRATTPTRNDRP